MTKPLALIIEDEEMLATIFEQALSMAEYETEVVRDGREAMTRLDNDTVPNVITLDLHLPFVSGEDILDHIPPERIDDTTCGRVVAGAPGRAAVRGGAGGAAR